MTLWQLVEFDVCLDVLSDLPAFLLIPYLSENIHVNLQNSGK